MKRRVTKKSALFSAFHKMKESALNFSSSQLSMQFQSSGSSENFPCIQPLDNEVSRHLKSSPRSRLNALSSLFVCLSLAIFSIHFAPGTVGLTVVEDTCALLETPLWKGRTEGYRITAPHNSISGLLLPIQVERRGTGVEEFEECQLCSVVGNEASHQMCTPVRLYMGRGSAALRLNSLSTRERTPAWLKLTSTGEDEKSAGILLASTKTFVLPHQNVGKLCDEVHSGFLLKTENLFWQPHSIVCVFSTITVPAGKTLQVFGGTTVLLSRGADVIVHGVLQVIGAVDSPVIWIPMHMEPWGGLELRGNAGEASVRHIFLNSWFVGGGGSLHKWKGHSQSQPVVLIETSELTMVGGGVVDSPGKAFYANNSLVFSYCIQVSRCDTGGEYERSHLHLEGAILTEFPDGNSLFFDDDNDGLYLLGRHTSSQVGPSIILSCILAHGEDDAIDQNGADVMVLDTYISAFSHEGIATSNLGRVTVSGCVISDCQKGIEAGYGPEGSTEWVVVNNTIVKNCDHAFYIGDDYGLPLLRYPRFISVYCSEVDSNSHIMGFSFPELRSQLNFSRKNCSMHEATVTSGRSTESLHERPCAAVSRQVQLGRGAHKDAHLGFMGKDPVVILDLSITPYKKQLWYFADLLRAMPGAALFMKHEGLARILDVCEDSLQSGVFTFVQEWASGLPMDFFINGLKNSDWMDPSILPNVAYTFARSLAEGLRYLSSQSPMGLLMHGDLKTQVRCHSKNSKRGKSVQSLRPLTMYTYPWRSLRKCMCGFALTFLSAQHVMLQQDGSATLIDWDEYLFLIKFSAAVNSELGSSSEFGSSCCNRRRPGFNVSPDRTDDEDFPPGRFPPECYYCNCTFHHCDDSNEVAKIEVFIYGYLLRSFLSRIIDMDALAEADRMLHDALIDIAYSTHLENAKRPDLNDIVAKLHVMKSPSERQELSKSLHDRCSEMDCFQDLLPGGFDRLSDASGWHLGYLEWITVLRESRIVGVDLLRFNQNPPRANRGGSFRVSLKFESPEIDASELGYFKSVDEDFEDYKSEIALSRLDSIIGIGVASPCVRRELDLRGLSRSLAFGESEVREFQLVQQERYVHDGKVNGSLCAWFNEPTSQNYKDSIMPADREMQKANVELLTFLGCCGKSAHNEFAVVAFSKQIALDNDRCFLVPDDYMQSRHWFRPREMSAWQPGWLASCATIPSHLFKLGLLRLSADSADGSSLGRVLSELLKKEEGILLDEKVIQQVNKNLLVVQSRLRQCWYLKVPGRPSLSSRL